jgi:hypothetical protein
VSASKPAMGRCAVPTCDRNNRNAKASGLLLMSVFTLAIVAACTRPYQELLQQDRGECSEFGFEPGTERYSDCLLKLDVARHQSYHAHH